MTPGLRRDKTRPAHLLTGHTGTKLALHRPFIGTSGTKLALHTIKRQFWALFRLQGEYSHARSLTKQSRAKIVTHRARQHKRSKETSPLREVLRAVVKHFSPTRVHKSQFWPFSTEQGRYFFHCGCMPGTGAIRWGDISFRTRPRRPIEPPILTHRSRDQQTGGTGVMGTEGHGRGRGAGGRQHGQNKHTRPKPHPIGGHRVACGARPRCRRAAAGPGQTTSQRTEQHQRPGTTGVEATAWPAGPGRGAGGRQHGQGKQQANAPSNISDLAPLVWRAPEGPEGTAAVPEGGGRARAGLEIDHSEPSGSRVAISRAGRRPRAHTAARPKKHTRRPEHQRHSTSPATGKGNPYSPRNALIAGISRTACTRPAR